MEGHFLVCENAEEEFDISFQVNSTMDSVIPKDQQELYVKAESACNIIKALENTDKQTKKKYFDKLLSLSQVGLVANPAQTETAEFALMKLKDEIVLVEGKRIKNHYMKYLGIDALISARNMFLFYKMDRMYFSIMYYNWCLNRNMGFIWCKKI